MVEMLSDECAETGLGYEMVARAEKDKQAADRPEREHMPAPD